ncbi:MAG: hypothetical protein M3277_09060 [Actinomycetota bacterium]|nr:hypothetical protein [Actinomycetota bacterium]
MLKKLCVAGALTLALGACGSEPAAAPGAGTGEHAAVEGVEAITFGESLAQIRGHHRVALELYEAGDLSGALVHAGHPIDEIITSVRSELEEHGGPGEALATALEDVRIAVQQKAEASEISDAMDEVRALTFEAATALAGEDAKSSAYRGSVIAALLKTAAHEFEEAVAGGKGEVKLLAEYQDGYAFVLESRALYDEISADVEAASMEEAEEIEAAFDVLAGAFPSPQPPSELATALDVEAAAELIGHELEETVDATLLETADPEAIGEEINELLDEILAAYEAGDADEAAELSAEAYLENYEVIEAEVIENAPDINEELEPLLGAELRRQIQEGAPQTEIADMIERARALLAQALEALGH